MHTIHQLLTALAAVILVGSAGPAAAMPAIRFMAPPVADQSWPSIALHDAGIDSTWIVGVYHAGDGSNRQFLVERRGRIWIVQNGVKLERPFLDVSALVGSEHWEQGLLGLAFPPGFGAGIRHFYIYYTDTRGDSVLARYYLDRDWPNRADPRSAIVVLHIPQPFPSHNAGQLAFGPDGYLYIGLGDGGSSGDPNNNAQNPAQLLGKVLRIDVERRPATAAMTNAAHKVFLPSVNSAQVFTYSIPADNPFAQMPGSRPEIWAMGLRNPWRFAFDRATGDLYIGDVGEGRFEEINFQPASSGGGENYGWRVMEGAHCYNQAQCDPAGFRLPAAEYAHDDGACAVIGGTVYRGAAIPQLQGIYLFADMCTGRIWGLRREQGAWTTALLYDAPFPISSFGEDEAGNVYVARYLLYGRSLYQVVLAGPAAVAEAPPAAGAQAH